MSKAEALGSCFPLYFDVHVVVGGGVYDGVTVGVVVGLTISFTAVICWVCSSSPVLQSNIRVQQKLGVFSLPFYFKFYTI